MISLQMEGLENFLRKDNELSYLCRHADFSFVWEGDTFQVLFIVKNSTISIKEEITFNDYWDFTISGDNESWNEFFKPYPKPFYHNVIALINKIETVRMTGNRLIAMQSIRCLSRVFDLIQSYFSERGTHDE
jgi:hypothetical protein